MSDQKLQQSAKSRLIAIVQLGKNILSNLEKNKNNAIEKELKNFLKECRIINLINYPISFWDSGISQQNLTAALKAISEKLKLFITENEFNTLQEVRNVILACQEKLYGIKNTPDDSKITYNCEKNLKNIMGISQSFRDLYFLGYEDTTKFREKYLSKPQGLKVFRGELMELASQFIIACKKEGLWQEYEKVAEGQASEELAEVLGVNAQKRKKTSKDSFAIIQVAVDKNKSVYDDGELNNLLDSIGFAAEEIRVLSKDYEKYIIGLCNYCDHTRNPASSSSSSSSSSGLISTIVPEIKKQMPLIKKMRDESDSSPETSIVKPTNEESSPWEKNIPGLIKKLEKSDNVNLGNCSEEFLITAFKEAIFAKKIAPALSLLELLTLRQRPPKSGHGIGIFLPSRLKEIKRQKQEISEFLNHMSDVGNSTAKKLLSHYSLESKRHIPLSNNNPPNELLPPSWFVKNIMTLKTPGLPNCTVFAMVEFSLENHYVKR